MSQLRKRIDRLGRSAAGAFGFGRAATAKTQAMLLGVVVGSASEAGAVPEAGVDVVVARGPGGKALGPILAAIKAAGVVKGAWTESLDEEGARALRKAGADFVVSPAGTTAASAVDTDALGQLLELDGAVDDTFLRSLSPLGLDGLVVRSDTGSLTISQQLAYVRLSAFSGLSLLVVVSSTPPDGDIRVLRDSGASAILLPASTSAADLKSLADKLRELPPRKSHRDAHDVALVPAAAASGDHEHEEDGDDE